MTYLADPEVVAGELGVAIREATGCAMTREELRDEVRAMIRRVRPDYVSRAETPLTAHELVELGRMYDAILRGLARVAAGLDWPRRARRARYARRPKPPRDGARAELLAAVHWQDRVPSAREAALSWALASEKGHRRRMRPGQERAGHSRVSA